MDRSPNQRTAGRRILLSPSLIVQKYFQPSCVTAALKYLLKQLPNRHLGAFNFLVSKSLKIALSELGEELKESFLTANLGHGAAVGPRLRSRLALLEVNLRLQLQKLSDLST
jgi:hypothetical protein